MDVTTILARQSHTSLTNDGYVKCLKTALAFLKHNEAIRNRDIRRISGIGYDQAIHFFKRATKERNLLRQGKGSGTHYIINQVKRQSPRQ